MSKKTLQGQRSDIQPDQPPKHYLSIKPQYILGLVLLMVFVFGLKRLYSPDIGFHLEAGKWMIENLKIMSKDMLTYTRDGIKYIDLHWLYQVIVYSVTKWLNTSGLVIINALMITFSFVLLLLRMRTMSLTSYAIAALLMVIGLQALPMETRPHVFSWLFLSLILLVLENYEYKKVNKLYWLPVIMVVWINMHSLAILGLVVIGAYVVGSYFESKKLDTVLVKYFLFSMVAFLINPHFIEGALYPLQQFGLITSGFEKQYIAEFQSPFKAFGMDAQDLSYILNPGFWLMVMMLICSVVCYKLIKGKQYTPLLICLGFLLLISLAVKNYGYFFFATLPYIVAVLSPRPVPVTTKGKSLHSPPSMLSRLFAPNRIYILSGILAIVITITTLTDGFAMLTRSPYRFGTSYDSRQLPVQATQFLLDRKMKGRLLNHLDFGGYLSHFYGEKTYIDGRLELLGKDMFEEYFKYRTQPDGIKQLISKYHPDIVIFPYLKATNWWASMMQDPEWKVVYVDHLAVIYVPVDQFPEVPAVTEQNLVQQVSQYQPEQIPSLLQAEKPSRTVAFIQSFVRKQDEVIEYENLSMYCFTVGFFNAALAYSAAAIDRATVSPETIYFNLYQYYLKVGDETTANVCLRKSGRTGS